MGEEILRLYKVETARNIAIFSALYKHELCGFGIMAEIQALQNETRLN